MSYDWDNPPGTDRPPAYPPAQPGSLYGQPQPVYTHQGVPAAPAPKQRTGLVVAVAVVVVLAVAAGAYFALARRGGAKIPAAASTPTSTPTASTATVRQYASGLHGPRKSYREAWKNYQDDCIVGSGQLCDIELMTLNLTALTVSTSVHVLEDRDSNGYVGPPPAEIAPLVTRTLTAAGTVGAETADSDHLPDGWALDAMRLDSIVDEWGPYLGG